jgi:hypothetical protein
MSPLKRRSWVAIRSPDTATPVAKIPIAIAAAARLSQWIMAIAIKAVSFQSNSSGAGADGDKDLKLARLRNSLAATLAALSSMSLIQSAPFRFAADTSSPKLPPTFDFGVTSRQGSRLG